MQDDEIKRRLASMAAWRGEGEARPHKARVDEVNACLGRLRELLQDTDTLGLLAERIGPEGPTVLGRLAMDAEHVYAAARRPEPHGGAGGRPRRPVWVREAARLLYDEWTAREGKRPGRWIDNKTNEPGGKFWEWVKQVTDGLPVNDNTLFWELKRFDQPDDRRSKTSKKRRG